MLADVRRPGDEVIVADSASSTDAPRRVATAAGVRVVRCARPGASRARNAGWRAARRPVVAFVDDDCLPRPGWVDALTAPFADPSVAFVFGRIEAGTDGTPLSVLDDASARPVGPGTPLDRLGGAGNLAVRRDVLATVGGFDEVLGAGAPLRASEDKDLQWRLLAAGWRGAYAPDARVVHDAGRSRLGGLRIWFSYGVGEGAMAAKAGRDTTFPRAVVTVTAAARRPSAPTPGRLAAAALVQAGRDLAAGYRFGVLAGCCRAAGALAGARLARSNPVHDGRYVP